MDENAISIKNLSKLYKLYEKPSDRVKEAIGLSRKKNVLYKEHFALSDVSFNVKKGECIGIIGTNGAGKSTLLKIITGVLNATNGEVSVNGKISALLELGAGFNMEYTGLENVYLNGRMNGFSKSDIDNKIDDILKFADIGNFVNQPVKTYSSGMFVRLAFAVAINIDPEILIVDEALSVGDIFFQSKCFRKFEEFKKGGKTIVFVSHSMGSIQKYCDRVIVLNKGNVIIDSSPKASIDLYNKLIVENSELENEGNKNKNKSNLRIYNKTMWKNSLYINEKAMEYGNGAATIIDYAISDENGNLSNIIEKGKKFSIKVKVRFNETVNDPIIAFTIKDIKGVELTGANTLLSECEDLENFNKDETIVVSFEQRMNLRSDEYLLALGCTGYQADTLTVYHRLYDITNIQVISEKDSVGLFDMNSIIDIEKMI